MVTLLYPMTEPNHAIFWAQNVHKYYPFWMVTLFYCQAQAPLDWLSFHFTVMVKFAKYGGLIVLARDEQFLFFPLKWSSHLTRTTVRATSRLRDTITQTWYYHVSVILCITQTWYLISGKFLTLKKMSARCALFRTLLIHTFFQQCVILKIVFSLKN